MVLPDLPQEILIDIFSRLAAKSVGRLRCLSKPWLNVLSSPQFIKSHLNRKTHQQNFILLDPLYAIHSIAITDNAIVCTKLQQPPADSVEVQGSCDGLVLLATLYNEKFLVNPITLQQVKIPKSPLPIKWGCFSMHGFGYDASIDDYKIVSLSYYYSQGENEPDVLDTFVYYVKRGFWKRVEDSPYCHVRINSHHHSGALLNGALHWLANRRDPSFACLIAVFNLADEVFADIPSPVGVTLNRFGCSSLGLLDDCLCIVDPQSFTQTDIWIMKEYGLAESWTKFSIVVADEIWNPLRPLCFIGDADVVLVTGGPALPVYNLREGTVRYMIFDGVREITDGVKFIGSLVSPDFSSTP